MQNNGQEMYESVLQLDLLLYFTVLVAFAA